MLKKRYRSAIQLKGGSPGTFRAVFATFNVVDHDGDVTLPGAFHDGQPVRISYWGHRWEDLPVGRGEIHQDREKAWVDGRFFLSSTGGRETYETVKGLGELQEWSYGFDIERSRMGQFQDQDVQFLEALTVYEISPVMIGAGIGTRTEQIKSAGRARLTPAGVLARIDAAEMSVKLERAQATIDTWRALESSKRDRARIRSALIDSPVPTNADAIRDALRARYPDQSEPWIEAMLGGELQAIADQRYRDAERQAFVSPNWAYEYGQVLAWAAQPAR